MGPAPVGAFAFAVVAMDPDGRVTALNAAAERLFATPAQQAIGQLYGEFLGPSLADRMLGLFLGVARSHEPGAAQLVRATLPVGRRATLRANLGPVCDAAGQLTGLLFVAEEDNPTGGTTDEVANSLTARFREALKRYAGPSVAASVEERPSFIGVGGVRQQVSVVHADVRGYTTVAENLPPEEVAGLLLHYHGAAVRALLEEDATLDRFIGDSVLAIWNAPSLQEDHARRALRAALALQSATRAVGDDLGYGVGVHTGEAVVGNLGTESFMNYTAVGDTVNVAARLQSAGAAGEVICSAALLEAAGPGFHATPLHPLEVKGRKAPIEAYQVHALEETNSPVAAPD